MGKKSNNKLHPDFMDRTLDDICIDIETVENELILSIKINNAIISHYICPVSILLCSKYSTAIFSGIKHSIFEPFSCSCGIAGCASIWEGVNSKYLKRTIQWRIPKDSGYDSILNKSFYNFSRTKYESALKKIWTFVNRKENSEIEIQRDTIKFRLEYWRESCKLEIKYLDSL